MSSFCNNLKCRVALLPLALLSLSVYAQQWDDRIIIQQCEDNYVFTPSHDQYVVKNTKEITYESNSVSDCTTETGVLYGEFISLDDVSGKGEKIYKNITPENVFYDDTKACIIRSNITKKGKTSKISYGRTFKDIKYFTRVYLLEDYFICHKTVTLTIPKALASYKVIERNFKGFNIQSQHATTADGETYTYTITNSNRMKEDNPMPPAASVYPYLLITGPFANVNELYKWSKDMATVNCEIPNMVALLKEVNAGSKTDEDKISNTYNWVQKNIRYVAFEAGISGHRPDTPAEVLRKRYGDCKGMALLLKTLLTAQGFDARLTDIGTDEIPYKMSDVPSLASANHVICTLFHKGKTYYMDATCNYIPYDYAPQHIQGSEAMIENGDKPLLQIVPVRNADSSIDSLIYQYQLNGDALEGKATYYLRGDMKEWFMTSFDNAGKKQNDEILEGNLNADTHNMQITNAHWTQQDARKEWATFEGNVNNKPAVQQADGEIYIELNPHNNLFDARIDTARRTNDYYFPVRCNIVRQAVFTIPAGYKVDYLPSSAHFQTPEGTLTCDFTRKGNTIVFHQKMQINKRRMPLANISKWNDAVSKWKNALDEQIILRR